MPNVIVPTRGQAASKMKKTQRKIKKKERKVEQQLTKLGSMFRYLGSGAGGAIGGYLGYPVGGAALGHSLGASLSKWLGSGDYAIDKNSILSTGDVPSMHRSGESIRVQHREFVMEVLGDTSFNVRRSITLNPGLSASFPWLSQVASCYSEYRVHGMVFHYVPTSGSAVNATNPALGSVMLQTTYRSTDSVPATKIELLNEYCANECVPSDTLCHPIECNPKENPFQIQYVRGVNPPSGDSKLLYDLGTTHVAVSGMPAAGNVVGDIWVTYDVEFKKPVVTSNVTGYDSFFASATPSSTHVFETLGNQSPGIFYGGLSATNAIGFDTIPGKYYTCTLIISSSGAADSVSVTSATIAGGSQVTPPYGVASDNVNITGASVSGLVWVRTIKASSTSVTLTFSVPTTTGTWVHTTFAAAGYW